MNAKADPQKEARIEEICAVYRTCSDKGDEIVFSVDEMTGIQALERIAPDLALAPGKPLAREFEYKRHGTQTLIAALRVAMGSIYAHCGETRTEADFCRFIATLIEHHPGYRVYRFVADQLNTHQSEALVRLAAKLSGLNTDLGVKGERGILRSMDSRAAFLSRDEARDVPLHPATCLVDEPDRDLVRHPRQESGQTRQLPLPGRSAREDPDLHRLLQRHHGQTLQVDLPRKAAGRMMLVPFQRNGTRHRVAGITRCVTRAPTPL